MKKRQYLSSPTISNALWQTRIKTVLRINLVVKAWSINNKLKFLSGMATLFRIMLMYYVNCYSFFEEPEKDCLAILEKEESIPPERSFFD